MKNGLNTYFTNVFKTVVKNALDRQTLCFTVAIFFITKNKTLFQKKTRTKLAATDPNWRLLTSPIVEKKHVYFPYVNSDSREKCIEYIFHDCFQKSSEKCFGSPNPLFYRCKLFSLRKTIHFFKKTRTKLAATEGY